MSTGSKRNQQAIGDVSLRESRLVRFDPVDIYLYRGIVDLLPDECIHCSGQPGDFIPQLRGDSGICGAVSTCHLHVDRRGQAKIQYLAGDIRGLEKEGLRRESGSKAGSELPRILDRRVVLGFE